MRLFGSIDRWLLNLVHSMEDYANEESNKQEAIAIDDVVRAAAAALELAKTDGEPEDVIAEAKWRYDIAAEFKKFHALQLERAPEDVLKQHAKRWIALKRDYFEWCSEPQDLRRRLGRYQRFWDTYHLQDEDHRTLFEGDFIRPCAYRLAALYAETGDSRNCKEMIEWLEKTEQTPT